MNIESKEVNYIINTTVRTDTNDKKELVKTFNSKLLKLILSFENKCITSDDANVENKKLHNTK